ncbi:hypothetical protein LOTGIDRAFT_157887 [Lottia gigantea]|uniref:BSD domain-containing protein n=1 Tax=Lottia gigantea TaxID=225164 RepID=V4AZN8_LOTGI|nr:hypothetical protein LOTGIDRAFT_157887 [Lottia gigantea]ESP00606.1 hypothetical protein LOTGIDRAFT_157887 [Lottia gigantea]
MAESDPKSVEEQGESWWGSWIQAAKETSASAYEMVKRDLGEFTCTVQSDTEHAFNATTTTVKETIKAENASTAKNRMKEGINTLFQGITKALTIPPDDEGEKPMLIVSSESAIYDRSKARLHAIQVDPGTYLNEPNGSPEHFKEWCRHFDIETKKGDISELLVSKVEVRALYTKLVPAELAHATFWQRYFYKLHQMALDEARKQALIKRAETSGRSNSVNDDWGSADEDDIEIVELKDVPPKSAVNTPVPVPLVPTDKQAKAPSPRTEVKSDPKEQLSSKESSVKKNSEITTEKADLKERQRSVEPFIKKSPETSKTVEKSTELKEQTGSSTEKPSADDKPKVDFTPTTNILLESLPSSAKETELSPTEPNSEIQPESRKISSNENLEITVLPKTDISNNTNNSAISDHISPVELSETVPQPSNRVVEADKLEYSETFPSEKDIGTKKDNIEPKPVKPDVLDVSVDQSNKTEKENDQSESSVSKVVESESKDIKMKVEEVLPSGSGKKQEKVTSDIKTKDKGDMVIVGGDRVSPTSDSSGNKDTSTEDDWDKDFDLDVTEEELKAAEELAKKMGDNLDLEDDDDDWENWE